MMSRRSAVAVLLLLWLGMAATPAAAFDLFARHQVTVQFATQDGKPMANAEVRVFAPGEPNRPALTGRTDSAGKFEFPADKDGFWSAEARSGFHHRQFRNVGLLDLGEALRRERVAGDVRHDLRQVADLAVFVHDAGLFAAGRAEADELHVSPSKVCWNG